MMTNTTLDLRSSVPRGWIHALAGMTLALFAAAAILAATPSYAGPAAPKKLAAAAKAKKKLPAAATAPRAETPGDFYRTLKRKPVATVEDAVRAVARLKGYAGPSDTAKELDYLNSRKIGFPKNIEKIKFTPVTKGNAVHLFFTAMDYKGGSAVRWLMPSSQRVSVRVAMYKKILPPDSIATEKMSGGELLGLLTKVVNLKEGKSLGGEGGTGE